MEPLSALSVACNTITIVDSAVKTGKILYELFNSSSGFSNKTRSLAEKTAHLKDAAEQFRQAGSHLTAFQTQVTNIARPGAHCEDVIKSISVILDDCKAKKTKSTRSSPKAWAKLNFKHNSNLKDLQSDLQ